MNLLQKLQKILHSQHSSAFPISLGCAFLLGAMNVLAFAPFFIWPIHILSLAALLVLGLRSPDWNKKRIFALGLAYGSAQFFIGVLWLVVAMNRFGGMPMILALFALALFALYLSLYPALFLLLTRQLSVRWRLPLWLTCFLLSPALWSLSELGRGYVMTGFPWLSSGYALAASSLAGLAPVLGVYGLGLLGAVCAGSIALCILQSQRRHVAIAGFTMLSIFVAAWTIARIEWTQPQGQSLSVRLLQGNIAQEMKFQESQAWATLMQYQEMITAQAADLIATPETAFPMVVNELPPDYVSNLQTFSKQTQSHLMLGVVQYDGGTRYANSILGMSTNGQEYRYDKHHLVPFGEFVPYGFRWFVRLMNIPLGELSTRGLLQDAVAVKDQRVMANICYEDLFGAEIAQQLAHQAQSSKGTASILLNVSNLAWYGDSIAMDQHLQISQMRAMEMGRPMLRATNTGATAIIDHKGQILEYAPHNQLAVVSGQVQGMQGLTPYIRFGDRSVLLLALVFLVLAWASSKLSTSSKSKK
jgi:apolipoprotein N-acyltransferase